MKGKVNNVIRIPTSINGKFFSYWLQFLKPLHNLTDRELQVTTSLIRLRYELSSKIQDEAILDDVVLGDSNRQRIMDECCVTLPQLRVLYSKLKQKKVILEGNRINPKFIPRLEQNEESFSLLLHFDLT